MPTEGAILSGAYLKQELCTDTTLESPLNGRRRCKDVWETSLSLRPVDRGKEMIVQAIRAAD